MVDILHKVGIASTPDEIYRRAHHGGRPLRLVDRRHLG